MSKGAVALLSIVGATLALAQQRDELVFTFETDPHQLQKEVEKVGALLAAGAPDDALALAEKLQRDPRIREGLVEAGRGRYATLDRILHERMRALDADAQRAYDARHDLEASRLEEQGTRAALERLLAFAPGSSRSPRALIRLAELELEAGEVDRAAARLEDALASRGIAAADADRARIALPAVYVLAGRRKDCADALGALEGETETSARRLAARAAEAAGVRRAEQALVTSALSTAAWTHENYDYYELPGTVGGASCEPACDATRAYVHDGSHCVALALDTGKVAWRTALREDGNFRPAGGPSRLRLAESVVVCILATNDIVTIDRGTGGLLARIPGAEVRSISGAAEALFQIDVAVAGDVLVVAATQQEATQEFVAFGLDARSGALLWRTPIGRAPREGGSQVRPTVAAGAGLAFVMPGWGALAALDPRTGGVAWLRRYPSLREHSRPIPLVGRGRRATPTVDSPPMRGGFLALQRGVLLAAPPDAFRLFGVDPRTGENLWAFDDKGATVVAGYGPGVIEVDETGVVAFVGRSREPKAMIPPGSQMGRAAVAGDVLLLPLTARASVIRIDLARAGLDRAPPSSIVPPAHLATSRGCVVAAGVGRVSLLGPAPVAPVLSLTAATACEALSDPSYAVRGAAMTFLANLGPSATAALVEGARSPDLEQALRCRAVLRTIRTSDRRVRFREIVSRSKYKFYDQVERLVASDPNLRARALGDLCHSGESAYTPIFDEMVDDSEESVARVAAHSALEYGSRSGIALVARAATSKDPRERRLALDLLQRKGNAEDFEVFAKALRDDDYEVRRLALEGALGLCDARAAPGIVGALDAGADLQRNLVFDKASTRRMNEPLAGLVLRRLARDADPKVRHAAVVALRNVGGAESRSALCEAIEDRSETVRVAALTVLREQIEHEDPPRLPAGVMEELFRATDRVFLDSLLMGARRLLEHGARVRPAVFATLASENVSDAQRVSSLLLLRRSVDVAPVDTRDVAAIGSLARSAKPALRARAYEVLLSARGPGRGAVLAGALDDPDLELRATVTRQLTAADTDVAFELLSREPLEESVAAVLARFEGRVLALACLRAADSKGEGLRARGREWLARMRPALEKLVQDERDPAIAEKLRAALDRSSR